MSFITNPTGSIYLQKAQGGIPPAGQFYAADANMLRQALLDIHGGTSSSLGELSSSMVALSAAISATDSGSYALLSASVSGVAADLVILSSSVSASLSASAAQLVAVSSAFSSTIGGLSSNSISSGGFSVVAGLSGNLVGFVSGTGTKFYLDNLGSAHLTTDVVEVTATFVLLNNQPPDYNFYNTPTHWDSGSGSWFRSGTGPVFDFGWWHTASDANPTFLDNVYLSEPIIPYNPDTGEEGWYYCFVELSSTTTASNARVELMLGDNTFFAAGPGSVFGKYRPPYIAEWVGPFFVGEIDPALSSTPLTITPTVNWKGYIKKIILKRWLPDSVIARKPSNVINGIEVDTDRQSNIVFGNAFSNFFSSIDNDGLTGKPFTKNAGNTTIGFSGMTDTIGCSNNVTIGTSLVSAQYSTFNVCVGTALNALVSGSYNTTIGYRAAPNTEYGKSNVFVGTNSGLSTSGSYNTAIGAYAGSSYISSSDDHIGNAGIGSNITLIGHGASIPTGGPFNNITAIGHNAYGIASNTVVLGNGNVTSVSTSGAFRGSSFTSNAASSTLLMSRVANGASAVGTVIDTTSSYTTSGAKLLSVRNANVEKAYIDKDGYAYFSSTMSASYILAPTADFTSDIGVANGMMMGLGPGVPLPSPTNIRFGAGAFDANTSGTYNVSFGFDSLTANTIGSYNVAIGGTTLARNSSGSYNTAINYWAMRYNVSGTHNTAIGVETCRQNIGSHRNVAIGNYALAANITGSNNTAIGYTALTDFDSGSNNTAIGYAAGNGLVGVDITNCTFVGANATAQNGINEVVLGDSNVTDVYTAGAYNGRAAKLQEVLNLTPYANPTPTNNDIWISGTNVLVRITGTTYRMNLSTYP